jgi:hypothetical protein
VFNPNDSRGLCGSCAPTATSSTSIVPSRSSFELVIPLLLQHNAPRSHDRHDNGDSTVLLDKKGMERYLASCASSL